MPLPAFAAPLLLSWMLPDGTTAPLPEDTRSQAEWRWVTDPSLGRRPELAIKIRIPGQGVITTKTRSRKQLVELPEGRLQIEVPVTKTEVLIDESTCSEPGFVLKPADIPEPKANPEPPLFVALTCLMPTLDIAQAIVITEADEPLEVVEIEERDVRTATRILDDVEIGTQRYNIIELAGFRRTGRQGTRKLHVDTRIGPSWILDNRTGTSGGSLLTRLQVRANYLPWTGRWDFFGGAGTTFIPSRGAQITWSEAQLGTAFRLNSTPSLITRRLALQWELASLSIQGRPDLGFSLKHGPALSFSTRKTHSSTRRELTGVIRLGLLGGVQVTNPRASLEGAWLVLPERPGAQYSLSLEGDLRFSHVTLSSGSISLTEIALGLTVRL